MNQVDDQQRLMKARKTFKRFLSTPGGKEVAKMLYDYYVNVSALGNTPEVTYYKLGQKELVQDLLAFKYMDIDNLFNLGDPYNE